MQHLRAILGQLNDLLPWPMWLLLLAVGMSVGGRHLYRWWQFESSFRAAEQAHSREAFTEAGQHLAGCLQLQPRNPRARFLAARVARRSNQIDLAREQLAWCADLNWPAAAVELERTLVQAQLGELTAAQERDLRSQVTADNPDRFFVLEALALGYQRTYRLVLALECLNVWLREQPDSPSGRLRRGWILERLERPSDAEADYRYLLQRQPDNRVAILRLANLLRIRNQYQEPIALLEPIRGSHDDQLAVDLCLAQCYTGVGNLDAARRLLEELSEQHPQHPEVLLELGKRYLADGKLELARQWLQRAAQAAPQSYEAHYQYYLCLQRLGDQKTAAQVEKVYKAIEVDLKQMSDLTEQLHRRPGDILLRLQIAEIFFRRGEAAEGANWLRTVLRLAPGHPVAQEKLASYYEQIGNLRQARQLRQPPRQPSGPAAFPSDANPS
jgi:tetratricopeptide (TPR) repeat protein